MRVNGLLIVWFLGAVLLLIGVALAPDDEINPAARPWLAAVAAAWPVALLVGLCVVVLLALVDEGRESGDPF